MLFCYVDKLVDNCVCLLFPAGQVKYIEAAVSPAATKYYSMRAVWVNKNSKLAHSLPKHFIALGTHVCSNFETAALQIVLPPGWKHHHHLVWLEWDGCYYNTEFLVFLCTACLQVKRTWCAMKTVSCDWTSEDRTQRWASLYSHCLVSRINNKDPWNDGW